MFAKSIVPRETDIFQLVRQIPTVDVIKHYGLVELRRSGTRWVGKCPIHDDRSPSFIVFPDGMWKCFGCQARGDAINLVAKLYGLKPIEAAKMTARDFGLLTGQPLSPKAKLQVMRTAREREAEKIFKEKINRALYYLQPLVRCTNQVLTQGGWPKHLELDELVHQLPYWEYLTDCLLDRDPEIQMAALLAPEVRRWLA